MAVIDSNSDPDMVDYPIPGNDDAIRAINLYCQLVRDEVLDGIQQELQVSGGDIGELEEGPVEALPEPEAEAVVEPETTVAPSMRLKQYIPASTPGSAPSGSGGIE